MRFHVRFQVVVVGEFLQADGALVILIPRVDEHVVPKDVRIGKGFVAMGAGIGPGIGVRILVPFHRRKVRELLLAVFTRVALLSRVRPFVPLHLEGVYESLFAKTKRSDK